MLTLETIKKDSLFVVKMQGWRTVGTFDETHHLMESPECRDYDLCAKQPDHLKEFYDAYWDYELANGFVDVDEFYNSVWSRMQKRLTKWNGTRWILKQHAWREIADRLAAYENTGLEPDEIIKLKGEQK